MDKKLFLFYQVPLQNFCYLILNMCHWRSEIIYIYELLPSTEPFAICITGVILMCIIDTYFNIEASIFEVIYTPVKQSSNSAVIKFFCNYVTLH